MSALVNSLVGILIIIEFIMEYYSMPFLLISRDHLSCRLLAV